MKFVAIPAAIVAVAALALGACTQQHTSAAPPPPTTTTSATDGTTWVPVTSTTARPTTKAAPKPPTAPASYTTFTYSFPPPNDSGAGGSEIDMPAPQGWTKSQDGPKTDYRDPTGQLLVQLQLDPIKETATTDESGYVVGLMQAREQATRAEYADYHLISLVPVALGQENLVGAQWQFTFVNNGVTRLVIVVGTDFDGFGTTYVSGPVQYGALVTAIADQERNIHIAG